MHGPLEGTCFKITSGALPLGQLSFASLDGREVCFVCVVQAACTHWQGQHPHIEHIL